MRSLRIAVTSVLFTIGAIAQNDCYYAAGERAGSAIVPCGSGDSISSCCQIGDLCLSDSACWNPTHNVTYLYGCSDPTYSDPSCPWKCGPDYDASPYVGLVYCYNTTQVEWSCTHPPSNSDSIQENAPQQCYDDSIVAFAGPSSLQPILSLPTNVGGSTVYFTQVNPTSYSLDPNYSPTTSIRLTASVPTGVEFVSDVTKTTTITPPEAGYTSTTSQLLATNTALTSASHAGGETISPTSSATALEADHSSALSTGAKAGIGVGISIGVLALGAIAAMLFFRHRKSHQPVPQTEEYVVPAPPPSESHMKEIRPRPLSELEGSTLRDFRYSQSGYGHTSNGSMQDSSAISYMTGDARPPQPTVHHRLHEME
ncbi:hypothetical protein LTR84_000125 [Exophiala bonariae]|uniref:Mid2 domain-containing protein n=1 Tax=Exophiala bonariae TaxID=1690606 RepID=A0AAV9NSG4_9EURO|nr:hypothetical protein LTR84_000125 [Exophiala bonariae]